MKKKSPSTAVTVNQLTVNYEHQPALWDISLEIPKGVLVGIVGPNGAGKSTLIKTILGLIKPLSGHVAFFGQPLAAMRLKVGYVPQKESVDWDFPVSVKELVMMGRYGRLGIFRRPRKADHAAVAHYLEAVGLSEYADRQISQLSGGQQQRAFLARALAQEADIYFLDEPFSGIDAATEKVLVHLFKSLRDQGKTVCVVHHELSSLEAYFDWIVLLNLRLVAYGPTKETLNLANLEAAYGVHEGLFDHVLELSRKKSSGFSL